LTPPPTDEKPFAQVHRVIALFTEIRAGKHVKRGSWIEFPLTEGEYDEIRRRLERSALSGYADDKIRCVGSEGVWNRQLTMKFGQI
jgi:hypothetical protein